MNDRPFRSSARFGVLAALVISVYACDKPADGVLAPWILPVGDGADAVESAAVPTAGRSRRAVTLIEDLVLGTDTGTPVFQPRSVAVGPDGRVFVTDVATSDVKVFNADGVHIQSLGRRGQGPGEFGGIGPLAIAGEHLVVVTDRGQKLSLWTLEGEHVADHALAPRTFLESVKGLKDGTLIAETSQIDGATRENRTSLVRMTVDGQIVSSFYEIVRPLPGAGSGTASDAQRSLDGLMASRVRYAVNTDGIIYISHLNAYQVEAIDVAGTHLWSVRVAWQGLPWTEAGKQTLADLLSTGNPGNKIEAGELTWPATDRALFAIASDGRGRLHVFPEPSSELEAPGRPVDIYSSGGEFVTAGLVDRLWAASEGDFVYALRADDLGEAEVVRYRLSVHSDF